MLSRDMLSIHWALWKLSMILDRFSSVVFIALLAGGAAAKYMAIAASNGGDDLLYSDIPRSIMLLQGRNPYLVAQWHSPYPPFLFVVVGGILWIAGGGGLQSGSNPTSLSVEIRLVGLVADLLVGFLIFLVLRFQRCSGLGLLGPVGLYLFLPPIGLLPYSVFHADIFGRLIMAAGLLVLVLGRYFVGTVLLTVSVIFKVHPLLALLLLLVWLVRRNGLARVLPSLTVSGMILVTGLVLPLWIPGYAASFIGYNLSTGFGSGTFSFSLMNLFYGILPAVFSLDLSTSTINVIWIVATAALFLLGLGYVWAKSSVLSSVDVVLLGLLVWLLPLRELYDWYVIWAMIPLLMRGRLLQSVIICGILEFANILGGWVFNIPGNPFPEMSSVYGFFITSLVYAILNTLTLVFVLRSSTRLVSRDWTAPSLTSKKPLHKVSWESPLMAW